MGGTGAAVASLATSASGAASSAATSTAGLSKLYAVTQAVSALSQVAGGISSMNAANQEADAQKREADLLWQESQTEAAQKARDVNAFQSKQAHSYASSGIMLQGTPIQVLEDTRSKGQQEIDAIIKRGKVAKQLAMVRSNMTRSQGRASMLGSLVKAGTGLATGYIDYKKLGLTSTGNAGSATSLSPLTPYNPSIPSHPTLPGTSKTTPF